MRSEACLWNSAVNGLTFLCCTQYYKSPTLYLIQSFPNPQGETEVTNSSNTINLLLEHLIKKLLLLELLHELVVAVMRVDPIGHHPAILDILVVGVIRTGYLKLVIV